MLAGQEVDVEGSKSTPSSWSVQRTRMDRVGPNSYSFIFIDSSFFGVRIAADRYVSI